MFRDRFYVSLVLTIPVVLYSGILRTLFEIEPPAFPGSDLVPLVISTFVFFYGGLVFLRGAASELAARLPGMMTLISLAITVAFVYSIVSQVLFGGDTLFWERTTLITVMLLGHWLEMRSTDRAQGALRELAKLLPDEAERITDGGTERVVLSELRERDLVLVRPGARVPADGEVSEGASAVNESMITGESRPVEKAVGAKVIAGTVNGDGSLKVKVTAIGERTALAGIMRLVAEAQASRSRAQVLADRAASLLTFVAITAGVITFTAWIAVGRGLGFSIERTVAVLVIACPHALGLAVPLVVAISTSISARNGLLVRDRKALEAARAIDVVLFDKTGTLTRGEPVVFVATRCAVVGAISLADEIRHESKEAVAQLRRLGMRVAMVTGDNRAVADGVAKDLGIEEVFAEVLPEDKAEIVKKLQRDGSRVAMVGDGVNDAPALTQADLGIAIGAGTDVAIQSAGIILVRNDPRDVVKIIRLSRATYSKMIQNLLWAAGYNVVAIPLAAGVLASQGILLAPAVGAIFMSASTIIVAANAQLLRGLKL